MKKKLWVSSSSLLLLFSSASYAFMLREPITIQPVGPEPVPIAPIVPTPINPLPIVTFTPIPAPTSTAGAPSQALIDLMNYVSSGASDIDGNYVTSTAQSLGYLVSVTGTINVLPYTLVVTDPSDGTNILWYSRDAIVKFPPGTPNQDQVCKPNPNSNTTILTDPNGNALVAPVTSNGKVSINMANIPGGASGTLGANITAAVNALNADLAGSGAPTFVVDNSGGSSVGVYCNNSLYSSSGAWAVVTQYGSNGGWTLNDPQLMNYFPSMYVGTNGAKITEDCGQLASADSQHIDYHELGHILGLGDIYTGTDAYLDPMYGFANLGTSLSHLTADELNMIKQMYSHTVYNYPNAVCVPVGQLLSQPNPVSPNPDPTDSPAPLPTQNVCNNVTPCTGDAYFDFTSCSCFCPLNGCPAGSTFDPSTCTCAAGGYVNGGCQEPSQGCAAGTAWNSSQCYCEAVPSSSNGDDDDDDDDDYSSDGGDGGDGGAGGGILGDEGASGYNQ